MLSRPLSYGHFFATKHPVFWPPEDRKYCHKQIGTAFYTGVKGYVIVGVNVYVDVDMDARAEVQLP